MRLLHTSDTHLGHQQYPRSDPRTGINQREQDIYDAWDRIIQHALDTSPDLFLHSGDLFDGVRPSNRALAAAMEGFLRLSRAGIETVVIAGNHEHPKTRQAGSPLRLFEHLDHIHPVYKGRPAALHLAGHTVHAVPQCPSAEALRSAVISLERGPGANVLMLHGAVHSIPAFHHAEFNEQSLQPDWFDDRFDYVALGHYHGVTEVTPTAWYCGAPERVSIREAGEEKGILEVDAAPGRDPSVRFRAMPVRAYADLPPIQCDGLEADEILAASARALGRSAAGAIVRLRILDVSPSLRGGLDMQSIRRAGADATHLDLRIEWADDDHAVQGGSELGRLEDEFKEYLAHHPVQGVERKDLLALATRLLEEAQ